MVRAYHLILTAYGFWLPNDPRGSWSDFVGAWELRRFGPATKVTTRKSLAGKPHDRTLRLAAKQALKYPAVCFNGRQALSISRGFSAAMTEGGYQFFACAILPEHAHLVVARSDRSIERVAMHLKAKASMQLRDDGLHPLIAYTDRRGGPPTPWAAKCWNRYLSSDEQISVAVRYVEGNPGKEGKRPQRWSFVVPFSDV